ncbi:DUF3253 domain-containing protein [Sphingomonas sp. PAMC 26621]|uniref:DUF3253 domain-containing protein n=1 Tax=Sphingomonas sp. PAMC 26621 TaxID=1112213 RepID=UPI000288C75E|nr:DUF3253 domain-containing protein [Sphingomonas sp. PAMC 26621]
MAAVDDACAMTAALLAQRTPDGSICPSEVARGLAAADASPFLDWRDAMPTVHAAVDRLISAGSVRLSWKGKPLPARSGPYRIRRGE